MKKIVALLLTIIMLISAAPVVSAYDDYSKSEGKWTYYISEYEDGKKVAVIDGCTEDLSGTVTIPAKLGGYNVADIDFYALNANEDITAFKVESGQEVFSAIDGVLYREYTYYDEDKDEDVEGVMLFAYPSGKKEKTFSIPENVTSMHYRITSDFVETINIPSTMTSVYYYGFYRFDNLKQINVADGNKAYSSIDGVLFKIYKTTDDDGNESTQKALVSYPCKKEETSYTVPEGTTVINSYAFYGCQNLEKLILPESLEKIQNYAFENSYNLADIVFPKNFINMSSRTFEGTAVLNDENNWVDGALYINNVLLTVDTEKIGESFKAKDGTVAIGDNAFSSISGFKKVTLPNSVKKIGSGAFCWCDNLEEISLGTSLETIGEEAFSNCVSLKKINIPDSVVEIGNEAFYSCVLLNSVRMSDNVKKIGYEAFYGCTSIQNLSFPNSLTSIGEHVFNECTMLEKISLPSGLENIDSYTFDGTAIYDNNWQDGILYVSGYLVKADKNMIGSNVTIKEGTTDICREAFCDCNSTSVTIPDSVVNINSQAFEYCYSLREVRMSSNIKKIGDDAFRSTSIEALDLGNNLEYIGDCAFVYTDLKNISIPASVKTIDDNAFLDAGYLNEITVDEKNSVYSSQDGVLYNKAKTELIKYPENKDTEKFSIPNTVQLIKNSAFYSADFKEISFPASVKKYEGTAFEACGSLEIISVNSSNTAFSSDNGALYNKNKTELIKIPQSLNAEKYTVASTVKTIRSYAGMYCENIQEIVMPKNIETVGMSAFEGCSGLKTIDLSNAVSIDGYAFRYCYELQSCTFGDKTKSIGSEAFENTKLTEVNIPASVEYIGYLAFCFCDELVSVSVDSANKNYSSNDGVLYSKNMDSLILYPKAKSNTSFSTPTSVESIEDYAFYSASNLSEIKLNSGLKSIGDNAFANNDKITKMIIPDSVESIRGDAFSNCSSLKNIDLGKGLSSIGSGCFSYCTGLETIIIPEEITYLYYDTFYGCSSLKSVKLNETLMEIYGACFGGCTSLSEIVIPDNVKYIGYSAFAGCTSLESVKLGKNVKYIGDSAFYNCALNEITLSYNIENIGSCAFGYFYNTDTWNEEKNSNFKIFCYDESAGLDYAVDNAFDYEVLPDDESRPPRRTLVDDETGVEIKYNDEFEAGTELSVEREYDGTSFTLIGKEFGEVNSAVFDISAYKDGEKVQPTGMITIRIPVPDGFDTDRLAVCYVDTETKKVTKLPLEIIDGYIVFQTDHFSYYAIVEVNETQKNVSGVSVPDVTLNYKKSTTLKPTIKADKGAEYTVEYSSSDKKVATVDKNGKVYGAKKGSATITCTVTDSNGHKVSDTCKVTVTYAWWQWLIKIVLFGWIWY